MMDRRRTLLGTAFEQQAGEWVWYANAWSRGLKVSNDEREIYLSFKPLAFRAAIAGRIATEPRRPYLSTIGRILITMLTGRDPKTPLHGKGPQ